jgi:aminoglycoside phosphotransferase (APT) family kinase protein
MRGGWFPARRIAPLGEGFINDTLLVEADRGRFVLQRVNEKVFPDPWSIVEKVGRVVAHLQARAPDRVPAREPARDGGFGWQDEAGGVWRLWRYVENTRTLQALENLCQAREAARAFGELQVLLRDLDGPVPDPIPGFMQLAHYLQDFDVVVHAAGAEPAAESWVAFIHQRRDLAALFRERDRLVHGDCKVNNLLFDPVSDRVARVLDLDTVMLGHWAWDFGDLARSAAADADGFSVERLLALAEGFVPAAGIEPEPEALLMAPRYVALMLGVRFLTDHLRGDVYFRVEAPGDNLRRAESQFALLRAMEARESELRGRLKLL